MPLSEHDERIVEALRARHLKYPRTTVQTARDVGLPLSFALAFLEKESSGRDQDGTPKFGLNLVGHDPVRNPIKGGYGTHDRYVQYRTFRRQGMGMQGWGPCQLTWYGLQDMADGFGGCWKPGPNMRVGFGQAKALIKQFGKHDGVVRYNGSGPAAEEYARDWTQKQLAWHAWLLRQ